VTIADLTGIGIQDAAIAALAVREALKAENGRLDRNSRPSASESEAAEEAPVGAGADTGA
jgi:hypothetical protein